MVSSTIEAINHLQAVVVLLAWLAVGAALVRILDLRRGVAESETGSR